MEEIDNRRDVFRRIHACHLAPWRVRIRYALFEGTARNIARAANVEVKEMDAEPLDKFELVVLAALILNMLLMGLYDPLDPESDRTLAVTGVNLILALFFVGEAALRFISLGHLVYTTDVWNAFDLLVIIVSAVSASLDIAGISIGRFTILRTIRVFRPLRSIATFPAIRLLVVAMIGAVRSLSDVALMYLIFLTSFGIIGVSQFKGLLQARCVNDVYWDVGLNASHPDHHLVANATGIHDFVCGGTIDAAFNGAPRMDCAPSQVCDLVTQGRLLDGFRCPYGYTCTRVANPFFGMISFDSLPQALLTLFVCVTGELWYTVCVMLMDAFDITAAYYFFAVLTLGTFFIVSLSIVLITISFESTTAFQQQKVSRLLRRKPQRSRSSTVASVAIAGGGGHMTASSATLRNKRLRALSMRTPMRRRTTIITGTTDDGDVTAGGISAEFDDADVPIPVDDVDEDGVPHMNVYDGVYGEEAYNADENGQNPQQQVSLLGYSDETGFENAEPLPASELPVWSDNTETAKEYDASWEQRMTKVPLLKRMRVVVQVWFDRDYVSHIVNVLIILNIGFMCLQFYGMPSALETVLQISNYIFTALFCLEFVVRLLHYGPHKYFRKPVNILDLIVLIVSILDVSAIGTSFPSIRAFRSVRLLKVLKSFPAVLRWAVVILVSLKASFLLMVTIFVFNYVAACFGMQLFGGKFCNLAWSDKRPDNRVASCPDRPRANFDSIGMAMLTAFEVMTGDGWDLVMYNGMRAVHPMVAIGFVGYFVVSSYVLVNILIGILLSGPSPSEVNSLSREIFETKVSHSNAQKSSALVEDDESGNPSDDAKHAAAIAAAYEAEEEDREISGAHNSTIVVSADGVMVSLTGPERNQRKALAAEPTGDEDLNEMTRIWRERLRWFLTHPHFETTMLWLILVSCIAMAFEDPTAAPDTGSATVLRNTDITITAIFVVEVAVNCFAFGVFKDEYSYLRRDGWNAVDLAVVLLSLIGVVGQYAIGARWLRVTLSIRAIRPLRFVKRSKGLRTVFLAFVRSIVPLRNILVLGLMIWTCWGLMGVQLFMGTFYSCSDAAHATRGNCTAANATWTNADLHFDHLPAAFLSLFTIASLDGWTVVMYDGIDSVAPDEAPHVMNRPWVALYFVSFVLVGSYFLVNLVVSVVIDTYNQEKAKLGDRCVYLTESQNAYVRSHRRMIRGVPQVFFDNDKAPPWRQFLRQLIATPYFMWASTAVIALNCVLLAIPYDDSPKELDDGVFYCSMIFAVAFAVEVGLKIAAVGPRCFLESRFNRFDLLITVFCLVGVFGEVIFSSAGFRFVFRAMRIVSMFRLLRNAGRLRHIIGRFSFALYGLANVAALLFLFIFIFAVMGMRSFGLVRWQQNLNSQVNFTSLLRSVLLLLQSLTGGNWSGFMSDCAVEAPSCDPHINDCGVNVFAQIFFVLYMAIAYFILVNLFIAVILDCFIATNYNTETISKDHVQEFFDKWFAVDTAQTMRIPGSALLMVLRSISVDNPLGLGYVPPEMRARHEFAFVRALRLREIDGFIELQSLVMSLCRFVFGVSLPDSQVVKMQAQADRRFRRNERERRRGVLDYTAIPAIHRVAVDIIEAAWVDYLKRKRAMMSDPTATRYLGVASGSGGTGTAPAGGGQAGAAMRLRDLNQMLGDDMTFVGDGASMVDRETKQQRTEEKEAGMPDEARTAMSMLRRMKRRYDAEDNTRGVGRGSRRASMAAPPASERSGAMDPADEDDDDDARPLTAAEEMAERHLDIRVSGLTQRLLDEAAANPPPQSALARKLLKDRAEEERAAQMRATEAQYAMDFEKARAKAQLRAASGGRRLALDEAEGDDDELHSVLFGSMKRHEASASPKRAASSAAPQPRGQPDVLIDDDDDADNYEGDEAAFVLSSRAAEGARRRDHHNELATLLEAPRRAAPHDPSSPSARPSRRREGRDGPAPSSSPRRSIQSGDEFDLL